MVRWKEFTEAVPELANFGRERLGVGVAYLATLRLDGAPRLHPVTPILSDEDLYLFMEPTSPKGHDLRRDPRYAMHSLVTSSEGEGGEFWVTGRAVPLDDDPAARAIAIAAASYAPADRYVLFRLEVESAASTVYVEGQPARRRWNAPHFEEE